MNVQLVNMHMYRNKNRQGKQYETCKNPLGLCCGIFHYQKRKPKESITSSRYVASDMSSLSQTTLHSPFLLDLAAEVRYTSLPWPWVATCYLLTCDLPLRASATSLEMNASISHDSSTRFKTSYSLPAPAGNTI